MLLCSLAAVEKMERGQYFGGFHFMRFLSYIYILASSCSGSRVGHSCLLLGKLKISASVSLAKEQNAGKKNLSSCLPWHHHHYFGMYRTFILVLFISIEMGVFSNFETLYKRFL